MFPNGVTTYAPSEPYAEVDDSQDQTPFLELVDGKLQRCHGVSEELALAGAPWGRPVVEAMILVRQFGRTFGILCVRLAHALGKAL